MMYKAVATDLADKPICTALGESAKDATRAVRDAIYARVKRTGVMMAHKVVVSEVPDEG